MERGLLMTTEEFAQCNITVSTTPVLTRGIRIDIGSPRSYLGTFAALQSNTRRWTSKPVTPGSPASRGENGFLGPRSPDVHQLQNRAIGPGRPRANVFAPGVGG